jgi:hypothetical protein
MFLNNEQDSEVRPKRTAGIRTLGSEYDAFLYAPIGKSDDDMSLSVLSALARKNIDAWEEAATLAHLSRESAIARLASTLSAPSATAAGLVALLPPSGVFNLSSFDKSLSGPSRNFKPILIWIVIGALIIATVLLGS